MPSFLFFIVCGAYCVDVFSVESVLNVSQRFTKVCKSNKHLKSHLTAIITDDFKSCSFCSFFTAIIIFVRTNTYFKLQIIMI